MKFRDLVDAFRRECRPLLPWEQAEYADCNTRLICQRCGRCILHCICPPPEMRHMALQPKEKEKINVTEFAPRR